jgi:hypothetical protein
MGKEKKKKKKKLLCTLFENVEILDIMNYAHW